MPTKNFPCRFAFVIKVKNAQTVSLEFFVFIFLYPRFYHTGVDKLIDFLHRFDIWLVHQRKLAPYIKFLSNLVIAFIFLKLRVARVNSEHEGSKGITCFTFETDKLLTFTKFCINLSAAPHCVYNLCNFSCSYFEKDTASSFFGFDILIQNQIWR